MSFYLFIFIIVIYSFSSHSFSPSSSRKPVIAIVANPFPDNDELFVHDYVSGNYVRWIEQSGGLVVVIHTWHSLNDIYRIMSQANGVFFQGGGRDLNLTSPWEKKTSYILDMAKYMNDHGTYFPIWGTCQGFQLLHSLLVNSVDVLSNYNSWNISLPSIFSDTILTSKMFNHFTIEDLFVLQNKNSTVQFHHLGVAPEKYIESEKLKKFFKITTLGKDLDGKLFINSAEGYQYPIYVVQFHPEKVSYDRKVEDNIPQNLDALRVAQLLGFFFVDESRKNSQFFYEERIHYDFINTYGKGRWIYEDNIYEFWKPSS